MDRRFDYFVMFAEMRTGSNYLETNLNAFDSFQCFGEAFNPMFVGYPKTNEVLGVGQRERDADPFKLLDRIKSEQDILPGFRYFSDHDTRIFDHVVDDARCAKIVLTRNPIDSYVSLKIAEATDQWKLTNVKRRKEAKVRFVLRDFNEFLDNIQTFQRKLLNRLQTTGQAAFYIHYEDLNEVGIVNGLAKFLGSDEELKSLDSSLKPQNPKPLSEKVENFEVMQSAISAGGPFDLTRTPNFEPRRGPSVPNFIAGAHASLLFMPMPSGPEANVVQWMADLDGVDPEALHTHFKQKDLRDWMRHKVGHRSFTVLRHPVSRAHAAFCSKILSTGDGSFLEIRKVLRNFFKVPLPNKISNDDYDAAKHRDAFIGFLEFLRANLAGQTHVRVDPNWASQSSVLQGMSQFRTPDLILREDEVSAALPALAKSVGYKSPAKLTLEAPNQPIALETIYDENVEKLTRKVYQRDYVNFGFSDWR